MQIAQQAEQRWVVNNRLGEGWSRFFPPDDLADDLLQQRDIGICVLIGAALIVGRMSGMHITPIGHDDTTRWNIGGAPCICVGFRALYIHANRERVVGMAWEGLGDKGRMQHLEIPKLSNSPQRRMLTPPGCRRS